MALADAALLALRQIGAIRRLPDLPGKLFRTNDVITSKSAFPLGVPDAAVGTCFYALNLVASSAGGTGTSGRSKLWSLVLAGNAVGGAVASAAYLWEMLARQKRICMYCLVTASATFAIAPLAIAEALHALRET